MLTRDYYEVDVQCTGSPIGKDDFRIFDEQTKLFGSVKEVCDFIETTYGNAKRSFSYIDVKGVSTKCGYVFTFENSDWSHSPVERWMQIDWVTIDKVHAENAFEEVEHAIFNVK